MQQHERRPEHRPEHLGPLDAAFWDLEDENAALHIAAIAVFDGPVPAAEQIAARYAERIPGMPRYHQKLHTASLGARTLEDDPQFDLDFHLRHAALPAPGGEEELFELIGRVMSARLDRTRPLWEAWIVEGLADGRWAWITKVHHSLVDGIGGMSLFTDLLDVPPELVHHAPEVEHAPAPDRPLARLRAPLEAAAGTLRGTARGLSTMALQPRHTARAGLAALQGAAGYTRALWPITPSSLTGPLSGPRRFRALTVELAEIGAVRAVLGGTVNDVALTMVSCGFRDLLLSRGETPYAHSVRTLVPVSTRTRGDAHAATNRVSAILLRLPVDYHDVGAAHGAVVTRMRHLKASHEAEAGSLGVLLAGYLPPGVVSGSLRLIRHLPQRLLTTVTTNVPGPREPVEMLGRRMIALYPYVPIADKVRIGVAISSYDGRLFFGVTSDRESVPDVEVLLAGMRTGLADLTKLAAALQGAHA